MTTPYDKESIGPMLARLRRALGYTQTQLAQQLCARSGQSTVTRHEVARWERQDRIPTGYWLRWLADVLAVPVDALQAAATAARGHKLTPGIRHAGTGEQTAPLSWLTFQHGPHEVLIALGAVEVDALRTVLAPVIPPEPMPETTRTAVDPVEASA